MKCPRINTSFTVACFALGTLASQHGQVCKCSPSDPCWPTQREWDEFNSTLGGSLIATIPLGSPCHDPSYDKTVCDKLRSEWMSPEAPIFANASCDPFTPRTSPCLLGDYVRYTVKAAGPADVAATLRFAEQRNIRLVIRNTAHDYMGRSTAPGALAIWTHFMKDIEIKDWHDAEYRGRAVTIGAGVEGYEILGAVARENKVVTTGECPTVGVAGGYVQSGGHSPLATALGLAADQTLEFTVVTASGEYVTANPYNEHADLFWALSGSGAGNYGVVMTVTLKTHVDAVTSGASIVIEEVGVDHSTVLDSWHAALLDILDAGYMATYYATNSTFVLQSLTGFNRSVADISSILAPFVDSLLRQGIRAQPSFTSFKSYHRHYDHYFGPLPTGHFGVSGGSLIGGRFLLRDALPVVGPTINASLLSVGGMFIGQAVNVSRFQTSARAIMPQWRSAAVMSAYSLPYNFSVPFAEMLAQQDRITNDIMPRIEAVTPDAGAYINEADFQQKDWQNVFFGENYEKLAGVKTRYDPEGLFWNSIAVGSERWTVSEGGKLCRSMNYGT